jgi:penicillin amidase
VFPADQEDLMVYELQRGKYQYQGAWTEFTSEKEVILVADTPPVHRLLYFSVHGPALYQDDRAGRAFGLRSVLSEPGSAPYLAALGYLGATNVRDFAKSLERWDSPGENHLFADVAENIGLRPAAMIPARTDHDGLMPVPGDGRFEWHGTYEPGLLPTTINPDKGWLVSANALSWPANFPFVEKPVDFEWASPWRIMRIEEVLAGTKQHPLVDSLALQQDVVSIPARRVLGRMDLADLPLVAHALFVAAGRGGSPALLAGSDPCQYPNTHRPRACRAIELDARGSVRFDQAGGLRDVTWITGGGCSGSYAALRHMLLWAIW